MVTWPAIGSTAEPSRVDVAGQPLAANVRRVLEALDLVGHPLEPGRAKQLQTAIAAEDAGQLQKLLDPLVLCVVTINPESRIKVERGPAEPRLQQAGFTPFVVKVVNQGAVKSPLKITSPQAGPPYGGVTQLIMQRQDRPPSRTTSRDRGRHAGSSRSRSSTGHR